MSALDDLAGLARSTFNPIAADLKRKGKKAVGFLCSYVPEEILHAADILPVRLRAPGCGETPSADAAMSHLNCTFVRSCLEYIFTGQYDFLDGLVFTNSCDHSRRLYDILRETRRYAFMHFISVPHKTGGGETASFFRDEIAGFMENVEKTFGSQITESGLRNAVDVYNETRSLLGRLYDLRKGKAPPLTGAQALSVVVAGCSLPRDRYNQLLKRLLHELGEREGIPGARARLMIAGSGGCDNPDYFRIMEDLGGLIVTDSLCFGSRCFQRLVEAGDDPLLSLARSYLERPCCASMTDRVAERGDFIVQMVKDFSVDGVVFQRIRYCDLWGGQLLYLGRKLKESNIPMLNLEREYSSGDTEQLKTRIQAFLERIERW
jgi:benzoyl-CoA reductase subunit C